jgi:hypothetical protein
MLQDNVTKVITLIKAYKKMRREVGNEVDLLNMRIKLDNGRQA